MNKQSTQPKQMSIEEYAHSGLSPVSSRQGVLYRIIKGKELNSVIDIKKVGRAYVLTIA